jgi:acetylornithine deacetylase
METRILSIIDGKRAASIDFLSQLIKIPSLTGEEGLAQSFLSDQASKLGMAVELSEPNLELTFQKYPESAQYPTHWQHDLILPYEELPSYDALVKSGKMDVLNYRGRPNLVATLKGSGGGRSLLLTGHIDTVTIEPKDDWKFDPFGAQIVDGLMYGRGASDMKGGISAAFLAIKFLVEAGVHLRGDIIFASCVNEEHSGNGTLSLVAQGLNADAAIVTEPTSNCIYVTTPGDVYWEILIDGLPRSPGVRWEGNSLVGVSAIEKVTPVLNALLAVERDHNNLKPHPMHRDKNPFSCVIGEISGGTYPTVTAHSCKVRGCMYFSPGLGSVNQIMTRIKERLHQETKADQWLKDHPVKLQFLHHRNSATSSEHNPIVNALQNAAKSVNPCAGNITGSPFCTDMEYLVNQAGIPTVIFGPGSIEYAHKSNECIPVEEYIQCIKSLALAIYKWCA